MKNNPSVRRTDLELPPGSYIKANINGGSVTSGTVHVKVKHEGEYSYLDYEYESTFSDGLIGIDPPYDVPTTWEISVSSEGSQKSNPVLITSEEYNKKYTQAKPYFDSVSFTIPGMGKGGESSGGEGYVPTGSSPLGLPLEDSSACCSGAILLLGMCGFIACRSFMLKS